MHNGNQSFCAFSLSWWLTLWHWVCHTTFLEAFLCLSMKTGATDSSCIMIVVAGPTSPLGCHLLDTQRIHLASFAKAGESPCLSPAGDLYSEVTWWWHACDVALQSSRPFLWCSVASLQPDPQSQPGAEDLVTYPVLEYRWAIRYQFLKLLIKQGCLLP